LDLRRGEAASSIAERIRHDVDHFADEHCDMRINQQLLDAAGTWRAARCVSTAFNPARWNPLITNLSGFGVYRIHFEDTFPSYCTLLMKLPVAGVGALAEGADGRGLVFQMALPPKEFQAMSSPAIREHMHRLGAQATRFHDCTVRSTANGCVSLGYGVSARADTITRWRNRLASKDTSPGPRR
jgi:hypothetical protein